MRALSAPLAVHHAPEPAQAIVILGAPPFADGSVTPLLGERLTAGAHLYSRGLAPMVCVTGGHSAGCDHPEPEADVMARVLSRAGVPAEALRLERTAGNTADNARRCAELLHPEGIRKVWLVTQPFHLRRALFWFRAAGFDPLGWHIADSLVYERPARGLRLVLREYGAWVRAGAYEVRVRARRGR